MNLYNLSFRIVVLMHMWEYKRGNSTADVTGDAILPPSSVLSPKSRYPSRRNAGIISTNVGGVSSHTLAENADADPIVPANMASLAANKCLYVLYNF